MDHPITKNPADQGTRRFLKTVAGAAAAGGLALAMPALRAQPRQGTDYRPVNPPQQTETTGKIEGLEFFWYGCPHSNASEPEIKESAARQPVDVAFRKLHVGLVPSWVAHQQMFFALEAISKAAQLNEAIFRAIHVDRNPLNKPDLMADFVAGKGIDRKLFLDAFNSFGVRARMNKASQQTKAYAVEGVPALAVNGKWYTAPSMVGGNLQALQVVDYLISRERKTRG
ncbi:MAG: thiol:disulfide interchange protein DsbA/DsbL [Quisquiliibacterium sp.]